MAGVSETNIDIVERLIPTKKYKPVIVNEQSNFIIATYWWGRNLDNANTARPCSNYYEKIINETTKFCMKVFNSVEEKYIMKVYNNLETIVVTSKTFKKFIHAQSEKYNLLIYEHLNLDKEGIRAEIIPQPEDFSKKSDERRALEQGEWAMQPFRRHRDTTATPATPRANLKKLDLLAIEKLEKLKEPTYPRLEYVDEDYTSTPIDYVYKDTEYTEQMLTLILKYAITISKQTIIELYFAKKQLFQLQVDFKNIKQGTLNSATIKSYKLQQAQQQAVVTRINNELKGIFKTKINKEFIDKLNQKIKGSYDYPEELNYKNANFSIYDLLNKEFRFVNPLKYDQMIKKWELECRKHNCNYMTVEYPEFVGPKGYQLAINGKCFFIKQALKSAGKRSIVYIDGDMFVRKYPEIFEMNNFDYMARNWHIDPRSSYKMAESISYDPYTFETSGGIMFFSQSPQAYMLCDMWIRETKKVSQSGKADDRLISLVVNTYKLLLDMKILSLPIEYLWLTLDYDNRLIEEMNEGGPDGDGNEALVAIYDYNPLIMKESIIIEHPECLTSEDTASSAGASSDRTPVSYSFLEENIDPVSESFNEFLTFPSPEFTSAVYGKYLKFMSNVYYLDDGNEILVEKELVHPGEPVDMNEQPLYITPYDKAYGDTKYFIKKYNLTYNQIAFTNNKLALSMNIKSLHLFNYKRNIVEINDLSKLILDDKELEEDEEPNTLNIKKILKLVIRLLMSGKSVIYNPIGVKGYNPEFYDLLKTKLQTTFKTMDIVFVPKLTISRAAPHSINYFYKPEIMTNQVMYFKPTRVLIDYLHMFLSLDDFSLFLKGGSYQFMSNNRVGYLILKSKKQITETSSSQISATANASARPLTTGGMKINTDDPDAFIEYDYVEQEELEQDPIRIIDLYNEGLEILNEQPVNEQYSNDQYVHEQQALALAGGRKMPKGMALRYKMSHKTKKIRVNHSNKTHKHKKMNRDKKVKYTRKHK